MSTSMEKVETGSSAVTFIGLVSIVSNWSRPWSLIAGARHRLAARSCVAHRHSPRRIRQRTRRRRGRVLPQRRPRSAARRLSAARRWSATRTCRAASRVRFGAAAAARDLLLAVDRLRHRSAVASAVRVAASRAGSRRPAARRSARRVAPAEAFDGLQIGGRHHGEGEHGEAGAAGKRMAIGFVMDRFPVRISNGGMCRIPETADRRPILGGSRMFLHRRRRARRRSPLRARPDAARSAPRRTPASVCPAHSSSLSIRARSASSPCACATTPCFRRSREFLAASACESSSPTISSTVSRRLGLEALQRLVQPAAPLLGVRLVGVLGLPQHARISPPAPATISAAAGNRGSD